MTKQSALPENTFVPKTLKTPRIYAYSDTRFPNCLKIGFTTKTAEERVKEQYPIKTPHQTWKIKLDEIAIRNNGSAFSDHDIHKLLIKKGFTRQNGEWFECTVKDIQSALLEIKSGKINTENRTLSFGMRPEQENAVQKTMAYFQSFKADPYNQRKAPKFLWNAKMRFGKTFATYQLAKKMNWQRILILTFKPAVQSAWQEDLENHHDFSGWQFIHRKSEFNHEQLNQQQPIVCFLSLQDLLVGRIKGKIKPQHQWIYDSHWDCVVFDEYHYGAWRDNAKALFEGESNPKNASELQEKQTLKQIENEMNEMEWHYDELDTDEFPITTNHYLYLSGTPFRAMASGEFIEEQIFNWTYSDEQKAKSNWQGDNNPYLSLPKMTMLTYQLPDKLCHIASKGEFNEFDLNEFFSATGEPDNAQFKHENEVQQWLNFIQNKLPELTEAHLKTTKPPMPFSDVRLLNHLLHTFWFLPSVASCFAMKNLLQQKHNQFFHQYQIIVSAGNQAGMGVEALEPIKQTMTNNPLTTKSITLSCGKLTTGVSVPAWTGIFMLRNLTSPETYFQSAFRVQTPWILRGHNPNQANEELILKEECFVFDFAPNRALRQLSEYACRLDTKNRNPEQKVADFIQFLPIFSYQEGIMKAIDAKGVLDLAMSGTTATLLARRWESALLVNVDNHTLKRLMENEQAMKALMNIEGFRSLNKELETIINQSENIKNMKKEKGSELNKEDKEKISKEEKEYQSLRKKIQEKLIKFATRIPVFMYLSDYREYSLHDVITQLEPDLFRKVTGLTQEDFSLLTRLNVFNEAMMNDAVYKFKRYEDSSLEYTGLFQATEKMGLFSTVINNEDYKKLRNY